MNAIVRNLLLLIIAFILFSAFGGCSILSITKYSGDLSYEGNSNSIIIIGDTQRTSIWEFWRRQNDDERKKNLDAIAAVHPSALIILGDLVFQGDSRSHWSWFDEFMSPIYQKGIPVFPLLGNHEFYGDDHISLELFYSHFPHLNKSQWYSFKKNGIGFIMLNSVFYKMDDVQIRAQNNWYLKELIEMEQDDSIQAIIVCCHYPAYTHSTVVECDGQVQTSFMKPFLETKKTAFFFSGHNHSYEHFIKNGKHIIVTGGGGGPRFTLDQTIGAGVIPEDQFKGPVKRFFHFCQLTPKQNELKFEVKGFYQPTDTIKIMDECIVPYYKMN